MAKLQAHLWQLPNDPEELLGPVIRRAARTAACPAAAFAFCQGGVTLTVAVACLDSTVAVMVADPGDTPLTTPI